MIKDDRFGGRGGGRDRDRRDRDRRRRSRSRSPRRGFAGGGGRDRPADDDCPEFKKRPVSSCLFFCFYSFRTSQTIAQNSLGVPIETEAVEAAATEASREASGAIEAKDVTEETIEEKSVNDVEIEVERGVVLGKGTRK